MQNTKHRFKTVLKDKSGMSYVFVAVMILVIAMIFSVVLEYASVMTITSNAKKNMQLELDSFCTKKVIEIYETLKAGEDISSREYTAEYNDIVFDKLSLQANGANSWCNPNDDNNVTYIFENPMTVTTKDNTLTLQFEFVYVVPLTFSGKEVTSIEIPMTITSSHKFLE